MGENTLVDPDSQGGYQIIKALERKNARPAAALWWLDEDEWRLWLEIPRYEALAPSVAYKRVGEILGKKKNVPPLRRISLIKADNPILATLRRAISLPPETDNAGIRITRSNFDGFHVEDAYIYRV